MANTSGRAAADKAQSSKTTNDSAPAASVTDARTDADKPSAEDVRRDDGQLTAHLAQQEVAKRTPIVLPDQMLTAEERDRQLSDTERVGSEKFGDVTQEKVNEDLLQRAALTPQEKVEKGLAAPGQIGVDNPVPVKRV